MSVSPISGLSYDPYQAQLASAFKQRAQHFTTLGNALQSGDLSAAQQAFAALKKDTHTIQIAQQRQALPAAQNSRVTPNFSGVETALNSGDLSGAKKAFALVQQHIQAAHQSRNGQGHLAPQNANQNNRDGDEVGRRSTESMGSNTDQSA